MRPRHAKIRDKRDGNHVEIVSYLRGLGFEVIETERPVDCLVWNHEDRAGWMEIKADSRSIKITRGQLEFMAGTRMSVGFVKTRDEAWNFAVTMEGLTTEQKNDIARFLATQPKETKEWHPAIIERVLSGES